MTTTMRTSELPAPQRSWLGVVVAGALLVLAIAAGIGTVSLGYWTPLGPGPGFFPLCLAVVLAGAAIMWGLDQWRGEIVDATENTQGVEIGEDINSVRSIAAIVASLVLAAMALEVLGFQITILAFLFFHLRVLGHQRWLVTIPIMLIGSFGVFALFDLLLAVPLPTASIPLLANLGL
ncbi:tripartite tricarboxylate transporter TctB family protein [Mycolicibacterium sp. 018/SC-01/001]|uniref:tripartite tricarboxylate transporter TctB family protein n=1 Tax=Mycolicibacterium sp. 018/SC-01/001 TaxID=2592069 RepID=UPI00117BEC21|nr:tripartite tricarboxylate transporter TctB family protein [Mycolicibacterium sp. 018/SC-01/001]TRW80956.1 tripartite tricarboxylate transporter TctB family protein [Mycolicibacterium sp. 018/SC-01/001]